MPDDKPSPPPAARGFGEGYESVAPALAVPIAMLLFGGGGWGRGGWLRTRPVFAIVGGFRALALGALLAVVATHRATLPPLPTSLGFLGVLLPLLFTETRVLK